MATVDRGELVLKTLPTTRRDGTKPEELRGQVRLAAANFISWTTPLIESYLDGLPDDGLSDHVCAMIAEGSEDIGRLIFRTSGGVMLADLIIDRPGGSKTRLAMVYSSEGGVEVFLPETKAECIELVTILDRLIPLDDGCQFGLKMVEDGAVLKNHEFGVRELRTQMSDAEWEGAGLTNERFKWRAEAAELPHFIDRVRPAVVRALEGREASYDLVLDVMTVEEEAPEAVGLTMAEQREFQRMIGEELYKKFTKGLGPTNPYLIGRMSIRKQDGGVVLGYERTGWWAKEKEPGGLTSDLVINVSDGELLFPGLILGEGIEGKLATLRELIGEIGELLEGGVDGIHFRDRGESGGKSSYVIPHEPGPKKPAPLVGETSGNTRLM